ncbi:MAG: hypothetical protein R3Y59_02870 [bacterium]
MTTRRIKISAELQAQMLAEQNVSTTTLFRALNYYPTEVEEVGRKFYKLRKIALENGGEYIWEGKPECDTYFTEVPHQMVTVMSERVKIVVDFDEEEMWIELDGKNHYWQEEVNFETLKEMREDAQHIAKKQMPMFGKF